MQLNTARRTHAVTHGGAPAFPQVSIENQLRRSVLSCLLWEDSFYESGASIADRICELAKQVEPNTLADLAFEARSTHNLRHVSLLLLAELASTGRGSGVVADAIEKTIQRADELSEFVSIYWRNGKTPLSKQIKKGLAAALRKFDAYQLAKYDREKAVRIRDVLFLVHAKPKDEAQAATWKALVDGTLPAPDTWEVALSGGADKRETWERMLREGSLGYLALLRNLRNMTAVGVDVGLIRDAIVARKNGANRVLPFRYVAAARACPQLEPAIDQALSEAISELAPLDGKTVVLVDVSGSMASPLSSKSDLSRMDAAAALASLINGDVRMFSFSSSLVEVPPRRGMAGVDAIIRSQAHGSTALAEAVRHVNLNVPHDRLIVITDEQATTGGIPNPVAGKAYMVNVASYKNGVGYGPWTHIDGFSEGILRWIHEIEA
jgi:60 kDa SS-A/Ro ribonucleoprotein